MIQLSQYSDTLFQDSGGRLARANIWSELRWTREILPPSRWRYPLALLLISAAAGVFVATWHIDAWVRQAPPASPTPSYGAFLAARAPSGEPAIDVERALVPRPLSLRWGQTLGDALAEQGLGPSDVHTVSNALEGHLDVRKLRTGDIGLAYFDGSGELASLLLEVDGEGWVEMTREGAEWAGSRHAYRRDVHLRRIEGELVDGLLINEIVRAGGRPQVVHEMANVLQWDMDFNRDLRVGDRFQVLYEEVHLDGRFVGIGEILALTYDNRGRRLEAYRFGEHGYYDSEGRPLQKMFLRSPLPFTRVTSRFSHRRFHPVLKVHRPHYGVDYGAPRGTPVRVTANGVVAFAGRSGGAGKMVKVRHANGYQTSYLHLSGFASGVRSGRRVAQGDVIGYVGSTGLSTGPHLDYRIKKNGRWLDPLQLKSDPVEPIPRNLLGRFRARRDVLVAALEGGGLPPLEEPMALADLGADSAYSGTAGGQ